MDSRKPPSAPSRWPFFHRLRGLLLFLARLSLHLPSATITAIRHRHSPRAAAIQGPAAAIVAAMRPSRSEPSLRALAGDGGPQEAAPQRATGSGELAAARSSPPGSYDGGSDEGRAVSGSPEGVGRTCRMTGQLTVSRDGEGRKVINGEYVREKEIGRGSYAKVVLYRHTPTGLLCALKVCCKSRLSRVRVAPGETALMDVHREVCVLQRLHHPNVVHLREVIDDPQTDKIYLVFEYVENGPLFPEDHPPEGGVGEERARRVFRDVVAALLYAHSQGVVHNDVKPQNILCTAHGTAKLSDFGVSLQFTPPNDWVRRSPGTPAFTAPECCTGLPYRGMAADTWALGCTLYAMVCGRHAFLASSLMDTYAKIQSEPVQLPSGITPSLADLLQRLLHKDPLQRMSLAQAACHPWILHAAPAASSPSLPA